MKKRFKKSHNWAIIAVTMLVMIVSAYLALSTDAFIDVGVVDAMATHDLSMYDQQRMRRYSQNVLYGVFNKGEDGSVESTEDGIVPPDSDTGGGVYNPDASVPDGVLGNGEVYAKLVQNGISDSKAKAMSYAYSKSATIYGSNFAIGLMANIYHEGRPGLIEYGKSVPNWDGTGKSYTSTSKNPLVVSSPNNAKALVDLGSSVSVGTGSCQWSFSRRIAIANVYLSLNKEQYTEDDLMICEVDFILSELSTSYSDVVNKSSGKSAEDCARIICSNYEKPANYKSKQHDRAKTAEALSRYLNN